MELLEVKGLTIKFYTDNGVVHAVNDLSLSLEEGDSLGLVGETGAGKTTTALGILNLVPDPPGVITSGEILFKGQDLLKKTEKEMEKIRGNDISMIFQDPMTALNPVLTVGEQIAEVFRLHNHCSSGEAMTEAMNMLKVVGIRPERAGDYPHQFSGGMKQRVIIAMALACNPKLLLADEPTTALDVTIQAQVLEMIQGLKEEYKTTMLLITHDLGIVAEICNKVAIMYAGEIVEFGTTWQIFEEVRHPYTKGLFNSIPSLDKEVDRLRPIRGLMPDPTDLPSGCPFHPRCPYADAICAQERPPLTDLGEGHYCRCHHCLDNDLPLYFPDEKVNEEAYQKGLPVSNPGNDILEKGIGV